MSDRLAWPIIEFCKEHGISKTTGYKEVRAGRLKITKVGNKTLVTAEARAAWLASLTRIPKSQPEAIEKRRARARHRQAGESIPAE